MLAALKRGHAQKLAFPITKAAWTDATREGMRKNLRFQSKKKKPSQCKQQCHNIRKRCNKMCRKDKKECENICERADEIAQEIETLEEERAECADQCLLNAEPGPLFIQCIRNCNEMAIDGLPTTP